MALIVTANYSLVAGIATRRKGRDDKLLATLLSTAPEERTAQPSSLKFQIEVGSQESSPATEGSEGAGTTATGRSLCINLQFERIRGLFWVLTCFMTLG